MPKIENFNRTQVIQRAMQTFHDNGFDGTSMQDLVDSTGLNRSSIYNSFGSKLEFFVDILRYYEQCHSSQLEKALEKNTAPEKALRVIFEMNLQDIIKNPDRKGCMIVNCKSEMINKERVIKKFLENNQRNMLKLFSDIIAKGVAQKTFNSNKTVSQYALYLFSGLQGLRMTSILVKEEKELRAVINTILAPLY